MKRKRYTVSNGTRVLDTQGAYSAEGIHRIVAVCHREADARRIRTALNRMEEGAK